MDRDPKDSNTAVLMGRAVLDLRKALLTVWKEVMSAREVDIHAFRKFYPSFTRYAETLLQIECEKSPHLPAAAICAKVNGFWPDGRPEGQGLKLDVISKIAPEPPRERTEAVKRLIVLGLRNPHHFDDSRATSKITDAFVRAAAEAGIENDSKLFETLRSLPQRYLGDWFHQISDTYRILRTPAIEQGKQADVCRDFSFVMLDHVVWDEFLDHTFPAINARADVLVNELALRQMEADLSAANASVGENGRVTPTKPNEKPSPIELRNPIEEARGKMRSAWLEQQYFNNDCSVSKLPQSAPSYNALKRYRDGKTTNKTSNIRAQLAKAFKCKFEEVPD